MIILIIFGLLIVFCLFSWWRFSNDPLSDTWDTIVGLSTVLSILMFLILGTILLYNHTLINKRIEETRIEYDGLCRRLEVINSEYEDYSKSDVIRDITKWNLDVYGYKYCAESKWTNLLFNKRYADSLQYIELEDIK